MAILIDFGERDEALATEPAIGEGPPSGRLYPQLAVAMPRRARRGLRPDRGREGGRRWNEIQDRATLRGFEAHLSLAAGAPNEALAAAEEALADRAELGIRILEGPLAAGLEAALTMGDEPKVDELLGIVEGLPPGELTPSLRALGARFSARRAAVKGDADTASAGFLAAALSCFARSSGRSTWRSFSSSTPSGSRARACLDERSRCWRRLGRPFERLRAAPFLERLGRVGAGGTAATALSQS